MQLRLTLVFVVTLGGCGLGTSDVSPTTKAAKSETLVVPGKTLAVRNIEKRTLKVGEKLVVEAESPHDRYRAVFEDDGKTGYFYALDFKQEKPLIADNPIVDALHIYNVKDIADGDKPRNLRIVWSADGMKAALYLNSVVQAIYNFEDRRGCCRTGFPAPEPGQQPHDWDETQMQHFYAQSQPVE